MGLFQRHETSQNKDEHQTAIEGAKGYIAELKSQRQLDDKTILEKVAKAFPELTKDEISSLI